MADRAAKLVAEFIGTFALVFSVGCNVAGGSTFAVLSIAATLMVMIYAFGGVSGGNFNPAVSLAIGLAGGMDWAEVALYMLVQILGGIAAVCAYSGLYDGTVGHPSVPAGANFGCVVGEFLYTFMLVFTVLNVAVAEKSKAVKGQKTEYFGIAIAFSVVAGGYGAGFFTGGFFNPAITISVDLMNAVFHPGTSNTWSIAYVGAQLVAGIVAFAMFRLVRPEEAKRGTAVEERKPELSAKVISEFVGAFFLVFTIGCNVTHGENPVAVFSIASSLMVMIYALGGVSGGHFNPAVTTAILLSGRDKIGGKDACYYILSQLAGGCFAGSMWGLIAPHGNITGITQPSADHSWVGVAFCEAWFTFVLAFTVLAVATTRGALNHLFALAIGFCVVVGGYASGAVTGGHMNPAVSVGVSTAGAVYGGAGNLFWKCIPYAAYQIAGGAWASVVFSIAHAGEFEKAALG